MSTFDWKKLSPHLPVAKGDAAYVERPFDGAARLATRVRVGQGAIAVAGPVGCGKSTELAAAAALLESDHAVLLVPLDRFGNLRGESGSLSGRNSLYRGVVETLFGLGHVEKRIDTWDNVLAGIRSFKSKSEKAQLVLMFDGPEKMSTEAALSVVAHLLQLRDEAKLVFVVPAALVTGPETYTLSSEDVRVFPLRVVPVGRSTGEGEQFLKQIAMRRLGMSQLPAELEQPVLLAAQASGGLPRTFLQILQDAAGYAALEQRDVPAMQDVRSALQDHRESIQRLLREGDREALKSANGSDGTEVPLERRLRLLSQGLLLEYPGPSGQVMVQQHPLTNPNYLKSIGIA